MASQTNMTAEGGITLALPGGEGPHQIATFDLEVALDYSVNDDGTATGTLDQDALRATLADALEAVAAELRADV